MRVRVLSCRTKNCPSPGRHHLLASPGMRLPLVLLTVTAVWSPAIAQTRPPPVAPVPIALDDDPAQKACIRLDPKTGATLRWRETSNPYPVAHYVEVERFDFVSQQWRSWYNGYVETSLTLRPK